MQPKTSTGSNGCIIANNLVKIGDRQIHLRTDTATFSHINDRVKIDENSILIDRYNAPLPTSWTT